MSETRILISASKKQIFKAKNAGGILYIYIIYNLLLPVVKEQGHQLSHYRLFGTF
jgi:hypothetical protein